MINYNDKYYDELSDIIAEYEIEKMIKKSSIFSKKVKYVNIVVNNDIKIVR